MRPGLSSLKQMLKDEGLLLAESELLGKKAGRSSHQAQRKTMEKAACRRDLSRFPISIIKTKSRSLAK